MLQQRLDRARRLGSIPGVQIQERRWSEQAERLALSEMDISLMPLPDTPWTRGKCAYKALQYMAAGVPAVVDDVGVSAATIEGAGHVAKSDSDWLEALCTLSADVSLRAQLGAAGRRRVERDFSLERWVPVLASILRGG
ncbi:MAG: hypothetical protein ACYCUM_14295 [Solirubrobacteraceae bacterium]